MVNTDVPRSVLFERLVPELSEVFYSRSELALEIQRQNNVALSTQMAKMQGDLNTLLAGQVSQLFYFESMIESNEVADPVIYWPPPDS